MRWILALLIATKVGSGAKEAVGDLRQRDSGIHAFRRLLKLQIEIWRSIGLAFFGRPRLHEDVVVDFPAMLFQAGTTIQLGNGLIAADCATGGEPFQKPLPIVASVTEGVSLAASVTAVRFRDFSNNPLVQGTPIGKSRADGVAYILGEAWLTRVTICPPTLGQVSTESGFGGGSF